MTVLDAIRLELDSIKAEGLHKPERPLATPQSSIIALEDGREVVNLCANNYLGLASHPEVTQAAHDALTRWGFGMASVRFICGTQTIHKELEVALSRFLGTDDTILYSSCFDANAGLFETILDERDAIVSDALNHASIIDGIRLCKARRLRYDNGDMDGLRESLATARAGGARRVLIATDGVFSMDGYFAKLDQICALADEFSSLVMVDDSHAAGFVGSTGRGTPELFGVSHRVDIVTGTLGKALGGASGGYTSGRREIIDLLRQRSRPYLFSNSLAPPIVAASITALQLIGRHPELRARVAANTAAFRRGMEDAGFDVRHGEHPIVPIMFGDAGAATRTAERLVDEGVYAVAFSHPVVPRGEARIRVQLSALHTAADIDRAIGAFERVRRSLS